MEVPGTRDASGFKGGSAGSLMRSVQEVIQQAQVEQWKPRAVVYVNVSELRVEGYP